MMGTAAATGCAEWLLALGGWALLAVGGMLLLWALFGDRSRGRKRCPKCWYDMSGAVARQEEDGREVFTCPECGKRVKGGERGLRKTRRRWGWGVAGMCAMVAAWGVWSTRDVVEEGWTGLIPSPVLGFGVAWLPGSGEMLSPNQEQRSVTHAARALQKRVEQRRVSASMRQWIHAQAFGRIERDLAQDPPVEQWYIRELLYASSSSKMGKRDAEYAPLIAARFEILNKAIAGSRVYAAVHGCGVGDSPAEANITTDWLGGQSWPCTLYTFDSQWTLMLISNTSIALGQVVDLGVAPEGATSVTVTTTITGRTWPLDATPGVWLPTRVTRIPVKVLPASVDPIMPRKLEKPLEELLSARLLRGADGNVLFISLWRSNSPDASLPQGITIGARVEVLVGDDVRYAGTVCAWNSESTYTLPWEHVQQFSRGVTVQLTPKGTRPPKETAADSAEWRLRLVCDRERAKRNPLCAEYVEGEFELPLSVERLSWPVDP